MAISLPSGGVFRYVALDQIRRRPDARPLDDDAVTSLAESILDIGLRNPINVRLVGDDYELVAGAHRLAAFARLGESEIPVQEFGDDDFRAELAMIDENLCRAELSPSDKARQTARRKVIYEALHPDTRHGSPGVSRQIGDTRERSDTDRFTADTAARTGQSERTVQRNVERGEKVIDEVVDLVRGTRLDTGSYLDKIKTLSPNDQVAAARRDLVRRYDAPERPGHEAGVIRGPALQVVQQEAVYSDFVALVDRAAALPAADVIAGCPPRERAALCARLSHLIDVFQQIMEGVAP